ncbi:WGR domain-containing protein [Yoonia sp. SS1-5]|uniref:WGR domain-containing protein n=1 Tax=Yoonia rhodophyticola TaxID=3137370 RepID=A0AAN0NJ51_9RHOB
MGTTVLDTTLYRIDPEQNMARYYSITIHPNLFGGQSLMRTWGRIGSEGQTLIDYFEDEVAAAQAQAQLLLAKTKRGYNQQAHC